MSGGAQGGAQGGGQSIDLSQISQFLNKQGMVVLKAVPALICLVIQAKTLMAIRPRDNRSLHKAAHQQHLNLPKTLWGLILLVVASTRKGKPT